MYKGAGLFDSVIALFLPHFAQYLLVFYYKLAFLGLILVKLGLFLPHFVISFGKETKLFFLNVNNCYFFSKKKQNFL